MATIVDVAAYILNRFKALPTMKLQKLTYYSQAHSLVTHGRPLFDADFEAWRAGPVSPELYRHHRGLYVIEDFQLPYTFGSLESWECDLIDQVCDTLGDFSGNELSQRTHREDPWKDARGDLSPAAPSNELISKDAILGYYSQHRIVAA